LKKRFKVWWNNTETAFRGTRENLVPFFIGGGEDRNIECIGTVWRHRSDSKGIDSAKNTA